MIVVDTNMIAYLVIQGEKTPLALKAVRKDPVWAAPFLWRSEFRNVLCGYIRRQMLSIQIARELMTHALQRMIGREYQVISDQVLDLAASSTCSAYDCEFVALALELGVPLVTVDKHILEQFPRVAIGVFQFVSEPG